MGSKGRRGTGFLVYTYTPPTQRGQITELWGDEIDGRKGGKGGKNNQSREERELVNVRSIRVRKPVHGKGSPWQPSLPEKKKPPLHGGTRGRKIKSKKRGWSIRRKEGKWALTTREKGTHQKKEASRRVRARRTDQKENEESAKSWLNFV